MIIKKKAKDRTRKNVARSSAIMVTHPLCWPGWLVFSSHIWPGVLDPQWTESVPITMPADTTKIPLNVANMMGEFYPPQITTPLQVGYESVTFYSLVLSGPWPLPTPGMVPSRLRLEKVR